MEFDRIKRFSKTKSADEIKASLEARLVDAHPKMLEIESILTSIIEMMHEKTKQYGGNNDSHRSVEYRAWKALLEGVERKANRLESLTIRSIEGDKNSQAALLDTYADGVGYNLMALQNLVDDFQ